MHAYINSSSKKGAACVGCGSARHGEARRQLALRRYLDGGVQTRTPRCTTQTLEAKPQSSNCSSFYLSLSRGSGELQRAAADVPVVGIEGDERNGGEEREPRCEGDAQADQGARLRPPPTRHILLCGRTAVRR